MNIAGKLARTMATRPFMFFEYGLKSVKFTLSYLIWKVIGRRWLRIGVNPHVASPFCFRAEKPAALIEVGHNFTAYSRCRITAWGAGMITIGNDCSFGSRTTIDCRERIEIGNHVLISWEVSMADFEGHPMDPQERAREMDYSKRMLWPQFGKAKHDKIDPYTPVFKSRPIVIEDDVWICARAMILKGVRIGRGSIIAAGAVVTRDVPPYSVAAGNPAVVVKTLKNTESVDGS